MRGDPTQEDAFHYADEWGDFTFKTFEKKFVPGEGIVLKKSSLSGGERNRLFLQRGDNFDDVTLVSGADTRKDGRGFALLDFDHDGWMDLALISPNRPSFQLYRNKMQKPAKSNRHLTLKLVGGHDSSKATSEWSSMDAYGAKVFVTCGDTTRLFEHNCGEGFSAQNSKSIHIGLGKLEAVDQVRVEWPSGRISTLDDLKAGSVTTIREREGSQLPSVDP